MHRPVTLFTGQWADLPLEEMATKAASFGYDGLELACWGDHFDVNRALAEDDYCQGRHDLLAAHGLTCWSISNHLVGQAGATGSTSGTIRSFPTMSGGTATRRGSASVRRRR